MKIISRISAGLVLAALVLSIAPTIAHAYLSPEQVFRGIDVPPTRRETEQVVKNRQEEASEIRDTIQGELSSTEDEPVELQPAAPLFEEEFPDEGSPSLLTDEGIWDRRQGRLDDQESGGVTIIIQNGSDGFSQVIRDKKTGEVLHSGAPRITATGTGEVIAISVLFSAATGTFLWARRKDIKTSVLFK